MAVVAVVAAVKVVEATTLAVKTPLVATTENLALCTHPLPLPVARHTAAVPANVCGAPVYARGPRGNIRLCGMAMRAKDNDSREHLCDCSIPNTFHRWQP